MVSEVENNYITSEYFKWNRLLTSIRVECY